MGLTAGMVQDIEVAKTFGFHTHQSFFNALVAWGVFYEHGGRIYPVRELGIFRPIHFENRSHRIVIWFQPWVVDYIRHCRNVVMEMEKE